MTEQITAHADPEGEAPWAMQVVVHAEKVHPPTHTRTLAAVARTVVLLLDAADSGTLGPDARAAVARWREGRIRKVVRRARNTAWVYSGLPGAFTREFDGVEVRAFVPGPVDEVPSLVAKLQVSGLDLTDPDGDHLPPAPVRIYLNPHVPLSTGKAAAQVAHAAQLVYETADPEFVAAWLRAEAPVEVLTAPAGLWRNLQLVAPVVITDAGFTEIEAGTVTCVAVHDH